MLGLHHGCSKAEVAGSGNSERQISKYHGGGPLGTRGWADGADSGDRGKDCYRWWSHTTDSWRSCCKSNGIMGFCSCPECDVTAATWCLRYGRVPPGASAAD
ncbi:hypothetical protein PR202_gb14283 [Eleusine coracana subsp. coracana]|uniref:Uncharacterized protein n=1 Tax=Eleusine coracana subsp. coracana TaxID=191504 RepID=A0AAV5EU51_ELECO|nr:hypothetical protein PR202_gb14283 [Eleusine coracana subsp. coracana]